MAELANCQRCDKLFVKGVSSVCQDCRKEEERLFEKVYQFIRKKENRTATVPEVAAKTDVAEELIYKFVREGRLRPTIFPSLGYPCEQCATMIQKGKLCNSCQSSLVHDLEKAEQEDLNKKEVLTYFSTKQGK
jgi:flagellar operon protein (TIGR03826 family)